MSLSTLKRDPQNTKCRAERKSEPDDERERVGRCCECIQNGERSGGDQGERDIPSSSGAVGENPAGHIHAEASERIGRRKQCDLCVGYAHGLLLKIVEGVAEVRDQVDASTRY